ncbi:MAG: paraquat-inducible protein A [Planctomycetes bacterium]|nr:paraquat-inducible protein A [Planctomycetota bacterium]
MQEGREARCPRCDAPLHARIPSSVARTWSLLLGAYVCYVPANVLAVSHTISFGDASSPTILSGVRGFLRDGDILVAALIFFASIVVPLLKLVVLTWMLLSLHLRSRWRPRDRTATFRLVRAIGRWSMLDLFVLAVVVGLLRLQNIVTFDPGPAAAWFGAVVVLTMLAAESFDPRLLWDALEDAA